MFSAGQVFFHCISHFFESKVCTYTYSFIVLYLDLSFRFWLRFCQRVYIFIGFFFLAFAVICVSPMEMIRTKFQSKSRLGYKEMCSMVVFTIKQDGLASLWRGVGPSLLRDVPFSGFVCLLFF